MEHRRLLAGLAQPLDVAHAALVLHRHVGVCNCVHLQCAQLGVSANGRHRLTWLRLSLSEGAPTWWSRICFHTCTHQAARTVRNPHPRTHQALLEHPVQHSR